MKKDGVEKTQRTNKASIMKRLVYVLVASIGLWTTSCRDRIEQSPYSGDRDISDENGNPKDTTASFFPSRLTNKHSVVKIDPYNWYSSNLRLAQEKILYNSYLGFDCYRLTWLRSFDDAVFITINKQDDKYWLTLKKMNRPFVQYREVIKFVSPDVSEKEKKARQEEHDRMMDTLMLPPKIVADKKIEISESDWNEFQRQLAHCDYWNLQPSDPGRPGLDGSNWIIEGHLKNKYWVVERWSPKDDFRQCGEFLIKLSGLEDEIY